MSAKQASNATSANRVQSFVGNVVNGFEIIKLSGQGKFSYVFKAKNVESGNLVALKLIKIFDMENEKQRDNCLKEVQLHSTMRA
jgi:serine/threonine protein kinase